MEDNSFYSFIDTNIVRLLLNGPNKKLANGKLEKLIIPLCMEKPDLLNKIKKYVNNISKDIEVLDDFYSEEDKERFRQNQVVSQIISATEKISKNNYRGINYTVYYL